MISLVSKFGSLFSFVWRSGLTILQDLGSFLRRAWQSAAENTRKLIVILLTLVILLIPRSCHNGGRTSNSEVQPDDTGGLVQGINRAVSAPSRIVEHINERITEQPILAGIEHILQSTVRPEQPRSPQGTTGISRSVVARLWVHNLGVEAFAPKGFGGDIRFLRYKDFGAQGGIAYFPKEEVITYSVGGCYNIHKLTKEWTQNTWLFMSYTPHTIIGGLRIDL